MSKEKFLIGIIDNEATCLGDLQRELELDDDFDTIEISLNDDIDLLVESIFFYIKDKGVNALIVDFSLSDNTDKRTFNGSDVIKLLHQKMFNFPAVIITSHSEFEAEDTSENPYLVFERGNVYGDSADDKSEFIRKLNKFIERYNFSLDDMEKEYRQLKTKDGELTLSEEERLLKLEQELVGSPRDYNYPAILKSSQSFRILDNFEKTTRDLLEKLNPEKK